MKRAGDVKRGGGRKKPTRVESDDRPRGYESTRMRQVWRDIDHAKRKAGIGPAPDATAPPAWDVVAMIERAAALVGDVAAWMTANAPTACAALVSGAELLRGVPVVGRLVELMPGPAAPPKVPDRAVPPPDHHTNGVTNSSGTDPEGGWLH